MYLHVLEVLHWSVKVEVFDVDTHVSAPLRAREIVFLMCIFALSINTSGEIGLQG